MADDQSEQKKDFTSILDIQKELMKSGNAPPVPEGALMEEVPIEKIDNFESLEEYSANQPPPPLPAQGSLPDPSGLATDPPLDEAAPQDPSQTPSTSSASTPDFNTSDFPVLSQEDSPDAFAGGTDSPAASPHSEFQTSDFPVSDNPDSGGDFSLGPPPDRSIDSSQASDLPPNNNEPDAVFATNESPSTDPMSPESFSAAPSSESFSSAADPFAGADSSAPDASLSPAIPPPPPDHVLQATPSSPPPPPPKAAPPPPPTKSPKSAATPLEKVKNYAEKVAIGKPSVPAAFPFSVLITGPLLPEEKEKLLDILARENMGIREIDMEPQLAGGRVLIPRISEYAAILLVQAMRGIRAKIKMGPSDTVFSTADTRADKTEELTEQDEDNESQMSSDISHPAENLPLTSEDRLPNLPHYSVIDTVTATAALKSKVVEAESSPEYQEIVEALQRELKYKAYRKGATAIVHFKIQLNFLSSPTHYRVHVMGLAIRPQKPEDKLPPPHQDRPANP